MMWDKIKVCPRVGAGEGWIRKKRNEIQNGGMEEGIFLCLSVSFVYPVRWT